MHRGRRCRKFFDLGEKDKKKTPQNTGALLNKFFCRYDRYFFFAAFFAGFFAFFAIIDLLCK